jgi:predicted AlkP superfamily phosphohydrolase/phosphomutase
MGANKVVVIGLDSVDKDIVSKWSNEGLLPTLGSLRSRGVWGDIRNPLGLESGSCWPSFFHSLSPSETGQYDGARAFDPDSYANVFYAPDKALHESIWMRLSGAGKKCAVIDAPYSAPMDEDINGIKIIDRSPHVPAGGFDEFRFRTSPHGLASEIRGRFGEVPGGTRTSDHVKIDTAADVISFRDAYIRRVENKTELSLYYLQQDNWDFFLTAFSEAHCMGHRCWHVHDRSHPLHNPEIAREAGDPLQAVYISIDKAVARLLAAVEEDTIVIVYLSHGIGPNYSASRLLDRILVRLDGGTVQTNSGLIMNLGRKVWRTFPHEVRDRLRPLREATIHDGFQPNRAARRCFETWGNDRSGAVRLNVAGREGRGVIQPGAEYDAVCRQLGADLQEIVNEETGAPLVEEVIFASDHYPYKGEKRDLIPDLMVTWNRSAPINVVSSPKIGRLDKSGLVLTRSGDHLPVGRFFALGADWTPRQLNRDISVMNFAPTIASLLGVDMPNAEGEPIEALRH